MVDFRVPSGKRELKFIINQYRINGEQVLLWQTRETRTQTYCIIKDVTKSVDEIFLAPKVGMFNFDKYLPIYFYGLRKNLLFKCTKFVMSDKEIRLYMPTPLYLEEERKQPRVNLSNVKNALVGISKLSHHESKLQNFYFHLIDISKNGCAFSLNASNMKHFKKGDVILINQLGAEVLDKPIPAKIMYLGAINKNADAEVKVYKAGIHISQPLDLNELLLTKDLTPS